MRSFPSSATGCLDNAHRLGWPRFVTPTGHGTRSNGPLSESQTQAQDKLGPHNCQPYLREFPTPPNLDGYRFEAPESKRVSRHVWREFVWTVSSPIPSTGVINLLEITDSQNFCWHAPTTATAVVRFVFINNKAAISSIVGTCREKQGEKRNTDSGEGMTRRDFYILDGSFLRISRWLAHS